MSGGPMMRTATNSARIHRNTFSIRAPCPAPHPAGPRCPHRREILVRERGDTNTYPARIVNPGRSRASRPISPIATGLPGLFGHRHELHAHASTDGDGVARLLAESRGGIEFPDTDLPAILAGNQHPLAARFDIEVARDLDVAGDVPGGLQRSVFLHLEDRDAVVAAVRHVHELPV